MLQAQVAAQELLLSSKASSYDSFEDRWSKEQQVLLGALDTMHEQVGYFQKLVASEEAEHEAAAESWSEEQQQLLDAIAASYNEQQDIRYAAARGWVDRLIEPHQTRRELVVSLQIAATMPIDGQFRTGVLQV